MADGILKKKRKTSALRLLTHCGLITPVWRQAAWSTLKQVGAKPSSEPLLTYRKLSPFKQT